MTFDPNLVIWHKWDGQPILVTKSGQNRSSHARVLRLWSVDRRKKERTRNCALCKGTSEVRRYDIGKLHACPRNNQKLLSNPFCPKTPCHNQVLHFVNVYLLFEVLQVSPLNCFYINTCYLSWFSVASNPATDRTRFNVVSHPANGHDFCLQDDIN